MYVTNTLKLVANTALYKTVDNSRVLNKVIKRITAGSVTRDSLAKKVISGTVNLVQEYAISNRLYGERSAEIIQQGRSILFANTQAQVDEGVGPLAVLFLQSQGYDKYTTFLASKFAESLGPGFLKDHALERTLSALDKHEHGPRVIRLAIDNALSGVYGKKIIANTFMSALRRSILDKKAYQENTELHRIAAWKLHALLTNDPSSLPPPSASIVILNAACKVGNVIAAARQIDLLQETLQLPTRVKQVATALNPLPLNPSTSKASLSAQELIDLVVNVHKHPETLKEALEPLSDETWDDVMYCMRQLKPLLQSMPSANVEVGTTWTQDLASVSLKQCTTHAPSPELTIFMRDAFRLPVSHMAEAGRFVTSETFMNALKAGIDLHIDTSHLPSHARLEAWSGNAVAGLLDSISPSKGLTQGQTRVVGNLFDVVDRNPVSLVALTHHVNPEATVRAVEDKVLGQFTRQQGNLLFADSRWLQIGPATSRTVVSKTEKVNVVQTITWPILATGESLDTLKPVRGESNLMSVTVNTQLDFDHRGLRSKDTTISDLHINREAKVNLMLPRHDSEETAC